MAIGLHRTGTVIMTAGFIMVIAFGGLVFSTVSALQQIGFLLFVGVAIDSFINCVIVMPAILIICGECNYWPRSYEKENKTQLLTEKLTTQHDNII